MLHSVRWVPNDADRADDDPIDDFERESRPAMADALVRALPSLRGLDPVDESDAWARLLEIVKRARLRSEALEVALLAALADGTVNVPRARARCWYAAANAGPGGLRGLAIRRPDVVRAAERETDLRDACYPAWLDLRCAVADADEAARLYVEATSEGRLSWRQAFDRATLMRRRMGGSDPENFDVAGRIRLAGRDLDRFRAWVGAMAGALDAAGAEGSDGFLHAVGKVLVPRAAAA